VIVRMAVRRAGNEHPPRGTRVVVGQNLAGVVICAQDRNGWVYADIQCTERFGELLYLARLIP
jgi:hypothetical protein